MGKQKRRLPRSMRFSVSEEDDDGMRKLASKVGLTYAELLRFMVRATLKNPDATCRRIRNIQFEIENLGGKMQ